jgi:hypothetical protein
VEELLDGAVADTVLVVFLGFLPCGESFAAVARMQKCKH